MFQTLLLFSVFSLCAVAQNTVEGWICEAQEDTVCIITMDGAKRNLISNDYYIFHDLLKLEPGDYLIAETNKPVNNPTINITHISHVGLKKILGTWETTLGLVYSFQDFSTLNITSYNNSSYEQYHYSITPAGTSWNFFAVKEGIAFARMQLTSPHMKLQFFDAETGDTISTISLTQISDDY